MPEGVAFRTKAQLAQEMIGRAVAAGVPFAWVTGDTVYGNDRRLRRWLEEQGRCYVLAVKNNEPLWADTERGSAPVAARRLAEEIPDDEWQRLALVMEAKGHASTIGVGCQYDPGRSRVGGIGCWCVAASPILRTGLLRLFWYGRRIAGGTGARGRHSVDHRRRLQGGQAGGGAGRVPSAPVGRLVPAHHPGDAGPCLSGGNPSYAAGGDGKRGICSRENSSH